MKSQNVFTANEKKKTHNKEKVYVKGSHEATSKCNPASQNKNIESAEE